MQFLDRLRFPTRTAQPSAPSDGEVWYDTALAKFRARQNGASVDLIAAGGGGARNTATGTVDFGAAAEDGTATVTVSAAWVAAASPPEASVLAVATADHDPDDVACEALTAYVGNIVDGVSADVTVRAAQGTWGQYTVLLAG